MIITDGQDAWSTNHMVKLYVLDAKIYIVLLNSSGHGYCEEVIYQGESEDDAQECLEDILDAYDRGQNVFWLYEEE